MKLSKVTKLTVIENSEHTTNMTFDIFLICNVNVCAETCM